MFAPISERFFLRVAPLCVAFFCSAAGTISAQEANISEGKSAQELEKNAAGTTNALLAVKAPAGTKVFREDENGGRILLGSVDETEISLFDAGVPAGTHSFIFTHEKADGECFIRNVEIAAGTATRLIPDLKMKIGELAISCLPSDVEIFIDGERKGRGVLLLGNVPVGKELNVEARSATLGVQSKKVVIAPNETKKIAFDLRSNKPNLIPDGRILLPETQLALASQKGAILKVDGREKALKDGAIENLALGIHVVEILLPLEGKLVSVWKGAFPARSATTGTNEVLAAISVPEGAEDGVPAEEISEDSAVPAENSSRKVVPAGTRIKAIVEFSLGASKLKFSVLDSEISLPADGLCKVFLKDSDVPVPAKTSSTTASGAILTFLVSDDSGAFSENQTFEIEFAQ